MLLRFVVENIGSFKDAVEFNMFPSKQSKGHDKHQSRCGHAMALRMGAIYGANGAGKSNLVMALRVLKNFVKEGTLAVWDFGGGLSFRLDEACAARPSGMAVEFFKDGHVFYYHLEFASFNVVREELFLSGENRDVEIFSRSGSDIKLGGDFMGKGFSEPFLDALERLVRPEMLLLSFLGGYYPGELPLVGVAYDWFSHHLEVVLPDMSSGIVPHLFDTQPDFYRFVNETMPELKTGMTKLVVRKTELDETTDGNGKEVSDLIRRAKRYPGKPQKWRKGGSDVSNVVLEDGKVYEKILVAVRQKADVGTQHPSGSD